MSDALTYLVKARPEAMTAPTSSSSRRPASLSTPKTRALITLITKVATQTKNGFHKYLVRARQGRLHPREILDAILHAFPALRLTKIVWAIDILLSMDIPEFRPGISRRHRRLAQYCRPTRSPMAR